MHHLLIKSHHAFFHHISQLSYDDTSLNFGEAEFKGEGPQSPSAFFGTNNSFQTPTKASSTPGKCVAFFNLNYLLSEDDDFICAPVWILSGRGLDIV